MGKLPYFAFYPGDWKREPSLAICSHEEKGVWIDLLCVAFDCPERGVFQTNGHPWSLEQIAASVRSTAAAIAVLVSNGVLRQREDGAYYSKRMVDDDRTRSLTRERVRKHRGNANVTHTVTQVKRSGTEDEYESEYALEVVLKNNKDSEKEKSLKEYAEQVYELVGKKVGKPSALRAIGNAIKRETAKQADVASAVAYLKIQTKKQAEVVLPYKANEDLWQRVPYPATWFNDQRYNDDPSTWIPVGANHGQAFKSKTQQRTEHNYETARRTLDLIEGNPDPIDGER